MIFESEDIIFELLKTLDKVPDKIKEAREYHRELKGLVYGEEFKDMLLKIDHIEVEKKKEARKKYARSIKDINHKILQPVNNVYSATGGSKSFDLTNSQKEELISHISDIRDGLTLEKWLETYWSKDLYVVDPEGMIFMEVKDGEAYPTYKSIDVIRWYVADGMVPEYIVFEPYKFDEEKDIWHWRVVDDSKDYLIEQNAEQFRILTEDTFENKFKVVPARMNSNIKRLGKDCRLSPIDPIVETEKELLRDRSILTIHKFLNGFSTPYRPKIICPTCHGTKKNGLESCTDCDGKGVVMDKDVTDEIIIPIDLNNENQAQLPSNFAGFISPDLEIWNKYDEELKKLFNECFETLWGTRETEEVKDQTAMGAILNVQPMTSRLNDWSDVAESQDKFFTEILAVFYIQGKKEGSISYIKYGRNYIIQPPEYLLGQYHKSKENNDSFTIQDENLTAYLTSKYKNDPHRLQMMLKKKVVEPYPHLNIETIQLVYGQKEAQKKGLFIDWWETLTKQEVNKPEDQLQKMFLEWFEKKLVELNITQNGQQEQPNRSGETGTPGEERRQI